MVQQQIEYADARTDRGSALQSESRQEKRQIDLRREAARRAGGVANPNGTSRRTPEFQRAKPTRRSAGANWQIWKPRGSV